LQQAVVTVTSGVIPSNRATLQQHSVPGGKHPQKLICHSEKKKQHSGGFEPSALRRRVVVGCRGPCQSNCEKDQMWLAIATDFALRFSGEVYCAGVIGIGCFKA